MKKVLIIGAHGKVGKVIVQKMNNDRDFTPVALFRKTEQEDFFKERNVNYVIIDLEEEVNTLAGAMNNVDAVVFAAGSGGNTGYDKTLAIDLDGAVKSMEAAKKAGVKRFLIISAMNAGNRSKWSKPAMKPYYIAKHYADYILTTMDLDYTILRPGRLSDKEGTGKITVTDPAFKEEVPREDVAGTVLAALNNDNCIGKAIEFNEGETPIEEVVKNL
jgi:nucleoside-diphosphate-sugar epimerase